MPVDRDVHRNRLGWRLAAKIRRGRRPDAVPSDGAAAWRLASLGGRRLFEARQRWSSSSSPPLGMPMWSKWRLGNCHKGVNRRISPPSCSNRSMASHSSIVVSSHIGGAVANDGGCWGYRRRKQVYLSNAWRLHTRSRFGIRLNGEGPRIW
jgi:hypothetical protein